MSLDEVQEDDRFRVEIGLADLGRIGLLGQVAGETRHPVADVVRGLVDVSLRSELEVDARAPVGALRGDLGDPLDTSDAVLDDLGDLGLDDVGRGSEVFGLDGHDRRLDVGQLADGQPRRGEQTEYDQQQADHRRQHGAAHREFRQSHVRAPSDAFDARAVGASWSVTGAPSRSFCVPFGDHLFTGREPRQDLHLADPALAGPHLALLGATVL